jgi:hypothetical protein
MKILRIITLGLLLWSMGLVWPDLNLIMIAAGLVILNLTFHLASMLSVLRIPAGSQPVMINHSSRPSRPIPVQPA